MLDIVDAQNALMTNGDDHSLARGNDVSIRMHISDQGTTASMVLRNSSRLVGLR